MPHTNQYILTKSDTSLALPSGFAHYGYASGYGIYASSHLPVTVSQHGSNSATILGDIFDPRSPVATNGQIANRLVAEDTVESLLASLQRYAGRYVVVASIDDQTVVIPDATGSRRVLFTTDRQVITSSAKLFLDVLGLDQQTDPAVETFFESDAFWANDAAWLGTQTADRRLTRLLPNHYLDADTNTVERRPLRRPPVSTRHDVINFIGDTLAGTIAAIAERYPTVRFSLSAGWDSRLLVAAAEDVEDEVTFVTFATDHDPTDPDVSVSLALAKTFDLNYQIIRPRSLTNEFVTVMEDNHLNPRISDKLRSTQYDYYNFDIDDTAGISGEGGEIIRAYYPDDQPATPEALADLYNYSGSAFAHDAFSEWLADAKSYADRVGINIFDLFYWEQRVGNWVSRRARESDIAMQVFQPFNNYDLLLAGLSIPRKERSPPNYPFFDDAIQEWRPAVMSHPINPPPDLRVRGWAKARLLNAADRHTSVNALKTAYLAARKLV